MRAQIIVLSLLACGIAPAHACPPTEIEGCEAWLDRADLERAMVAEGLCGARLRCEGDAVILGVGAEAPRHVLSTIPVGVRPRIVALLVAEQQREMGVLPRRPEPEGVVPVANERSPAIESDPESGSALDADVPPTAERSHPPRTGLHSEVLPSAERREQARASSPFAGRSRRARPGALYVSSQPELPDRVWLVGLAAQSRVFLRPMTALTGPSIALSAGAFRAEAGWGFGRARDANYGSASLHLGTLSVGLAVFCFHSSMAGLCLSTMATVGYARVDPTPAAGATAIPARSAYGGAALELEGWLSTERFGVSLAVRGGWSYGLVAQADGRDFASLGGVFLGVRLGLHLGVL